MGSDVEPDEVLGQLDEAAETFQFPGLPSDRFHLADGRLTAFRSDDEWLIVFQTVGWATREARFDVIVTAFGNQLERRGFQDAVEVVKAPGGESVVDPDDNLVLDLRDLKVEVHGNKRELSPSDKDLKAARVDDEDMPEPARIIRLLAKQLGDELFIPDDELLDVCGRADGDLEPLLRAKGWQQPDLVADEQPSDMPCLRSLADAVAEGDAKRYDCPESAWNTHWTYWED